MTGGSSDDESTAPTESARPAGIGDHVAIVDLAGELREHTASQRGGPLWAAHDAVPAPTLESLAARTLDPTLATLVGCLDGQVLAYGLVHLESLAGAGPLGVIDELFVAEPARSVGLGEVLLAALVAWCRVQGCSAIDATALPGDRTAKNFFESAGFTARSLTMHTVLH